MGCLNSNQGFSHWFGNIHFSGPCNRSCYFCIGQHMMALDPYNNLRKWPLDGLEEFTDTCIKRGTKEVNLTGSNTDPLLFSHLDNLRDYLDIRLDGVQLGIRTNGALVLNHPEKWELFDKGSISLPTFDNDLYREIMGNGAPPNLAKIVDITPWPIKINIVLCPEILRIDSSRGKIVGWPIGRNDLAYTTPDLLITLWLLHQMGIRKVNLREPYGQPHIGDPMNKLGFKPSGKKRYGMPVYVFQGMEITYWDVHYVEVESVNLYANGRVSETYPITKGHDPSGIVLGQEHFTKSGRVRDQWLTTK